MGNPWGKSGCVQPLSRSSALRCVGSEERRGRERSVVICTALGGSWMRNRDSVGRCTGPPRRGAVPPRVCPASDPPSGLRSASRAAPAFRWCGDNGIRRGTSGSGRAPLCAEATGRRPTGGTGWAWHSFSPFCRLANHGAALLPLQSFPRAAQREERRCPPAAGAKLSAEGSLLRSSLPSPALLPGGKRRRNGDLRYRRCWF